MYSLAHILHGVWQIAEHLILLGINTLTLGVNPTSALPTLHHSRLVIVVIVATLAQRAVRTLALLVAAGGAQV